jgi:hypothetical protein
MGYAIDDRLSQRDSRYMSADYCRARRRYADIIE